MPTMKEVANLGLGKLGASRVNNLTPSISTLENKIASEYPQWKRGEISKRRWHFAMKLDIINAGLTTLPNMPDGRIYIFNTPGNMLRALRPKNCTWVIRGQFIYDFQNTINLEYISEVPDNQMSDPLFIDVLACRVAVECAELATQSPGKRRDMQVMYAQAIEVAGRMNAFALEQHQTGGDDKAYTWDTARQYPSMSGYDNG